MVPIDRHLVGMYKWTQVRTVQHEALPSTGVYSVQLAQLCVSVQSTQSL